MKRTLPDGEGRQIVVGLSGGVDSAVSAWLLKEAGWQVTGLFMKNWEDDDDSEYCSSRQDWLDAASVADVIGIDLEAVNFAADYRERVFSLFLQAYEAGFTPNPDILCNAEIKFKAFLDHALALGAERIATGHYAGNRIGPDGLVQLLRGADANKDQSYFLHRLNQYQLSRAVFPLAGITKPEVREIAARIGLPNATKKDSTGICFIGERPFRDFLANYFENKPGKMMTPQGVWVGEHIGLMYYTIGQRQGLGIGGIAGASEAPWYVLDKNPADNTLIVGQGEHPLLYHDTLTARQLAWLNEAPEAGRVYQAKTRYRQPDQNCRITWQGDDEITVHFEQPQRAITPGQYLVIYDGERCLGGGVVGGVAQAAVAKASAVSDRRVMGAGGVA